MSKFKIPAIPHTTPKSIRFPDELIVEIENAIKGKNSTFSAFVLEAIRFALDNLKDN